MNPRIVVGPANVAAKSRQIDQNGNWRGPDFRLVLLFARTGDSDCNIVRVDQSRESEIAVV